MVLITSNKAKQLLLLSYSGEVHPDQLEEVEEDVRVLATDLASGFRVLVDLSDLTSMHIDCVKGIGKLMEIVDKGGVGMVVRVIPDPHKDIGFNILSIFHYTNRPQIITCKSMVEAGNYLG
ncbi:MAG TPA: hypothetical protein VGN23_01490, partial [Verrucomicrobiae bacterium]